MTFTNFCEQILLAIHQENQGSDGWVSFGHLKEKYGLSAELSWSFRAMEYLKAQGWIDGRSLLGGNDNSVLGRITGPGMVYIEAKYGSKDGVGQILEPVAKPELVSANGGAEPQVVLADTVEAEIIPASDRLVRLDHNQPSLQQAVSDARQLAADLAASNDVGSLSPEERQMAIEETEEIAAALTRPAVRMPSFGDRAKSTLSWIAKEAAGALVGAAALALLALLAHVLGFVF